MGSVRQFRIFLASPSDTSLERALVGEIVDKFNGEPSKNNVHFELLQWELTPGSVGRPQESINALVHQCDFMVCIFKGKWGSDPGGGVYSSGTEEEFFTGLVGLNDIAHPIRNIWMIFLDYQNFSIAREIKELKEQIIDSKALLFEEAVTAEIFAEKFERRLRGWGGTTGDKETQHIPLIPRSGHDVVGASSHCRRGLMLADLGAPNQAEEAFLAALEVGGVPEQLAFAQFLGRQSRLREGLILVQDAINTLISKQDSRPTLIAEAYIAKASLERRQGHYRRAAATLRSSLPYVQGSDWNVVVLRARVNDELGVSSYHQGMAALENRDLEGCREFFIVSSRYLNDALEDRESIDHEAGIAQSKINIGRLHAGRGKFKKAIVSFDAAINFLESRGGEILANAYLGRAQAVLTWYSANKVKDTQRVRSRPQLNRALDDAENSLATNQQLNNQRGEAMATNILAQIHSLRGDKAKSMKFARRCLDINSELGMGAPMIVKQLAGVENGAPVAGENYID